MSPRKIYGEDVNGNRVHIGTSKERGSSYKPLMSRTSPLFIPVPEYLRGQVSVVYDREGRACIGYLLTDHRARLLIDVVWEKTNALYKGTKVYVDLTHGQPVNSPENVRALIEAAKQFGAIKR